VNLPRHPLRLNVGFLVHQQIGYNRDIHFDFPEVQLDDDFLASDFKGVVRVSRTPQGVLCQCAFQGSVIVSCVRCLTDFTQPLRTEFSELFAFSERSTTESDLMLPDDGTIDLAPLAREYLLIEIPISAVCKPDCKGLCPVCGENWNLQICEHITLDELE
jgi:uncharacterized protein